MPKKRDDEKELTPEEKDRICRELCPELYEDDVFSDAMDYIRIQCNRD